MTRRGEIQGGHDPEELEPMWSSERIPSWSEQLTVRGSDEAEPHHGLVPTLNVSAALLAFVFVRTWTKLLHSAGIVSTPFTRQENTVIQTCAVACYSVAVGASGGGTEGNSPGSYKEPGIGWMTGFLFIVSFVGLLALVPLRKIMIIDYKLTYPSGTATAVLINGFHTPRGTRWKQVRGFTKFFTLSFLWSFFQWFYAGEMFFFDFSMTYVGAGMICSHLVNISLLIGAVLSWGIMWPLIRDLKGDWYPGTLPEGSMKSLQGYKVFISIALILGDGLYNFVKILGCTARSIHSRHRATGHKIVADNGVVALDDHQRNELFMKESIPVWLAFVGYILFALGSVIAIPLMFPEVKWYYVVIAYLLAPALSFCNAYGAGLTDMNMAYNYGKVALFILAAWAGQNNGVVAGLVGCGLIKSVAVGTAIGCVVAPLAFFLFYKAFDVGNPDGSFKAPYALIYRNMAILGVEGFSALPRHCLQLCYGFFGFAVAANIARDLSPEIYGRWIPLPMVMAVPFLVGELRHRHVRREPGGIRWHWFDSKKATVIVPAVASGLICGDGLWTLPSSLLALAKINPPICMKFLPS
ncbi:unnamed protein product [Spirodela intermedia]|uniref:Uncharacterized protein n=1 Tax=Spirodela intermedia TaxID=51605 RepID=A0A7I8IZM6_SPIIN|nr:unnamed protein product [Spirodela intermedia]CAA6663338.1 unnamed protein product [Spirodela intermedia]